MGFRLLYTVNECRARVIGPRRSRSSPRSSLFEPISQRWLQQPQCPASGVEPPYQAPSASSIPSEPDRSSPGPPTVVPPASAKATSESETSPRKSESSAPNSSSTISKMPNSSPYATPCGTSSSPDVLGPYDTNPNLLTATSAPSKSAALPPPPNTTSPSAYAP